MALNRYRLRHKARMKKKQAMQLMQLLKRPDRLLGAILIGSTFTNMIASSLATLLAYHFWGDTGAIFGAVILTIIVLIFAEITPKTLAAIYPDEIAQVIFYPIKFILKVMYPAVCLASAIANGLLRLLHVRVKTSESESLSREELRSVVYDATGKISPRYQTMLLAVLDLSKLIVDDVMVTRHEIAGVDIEDSWENIVANIYKFQQDWLPVYRESVNHVIGVLYTRDIVRLLLLQKTLNKEILQQFLQEPYFVPSGTSLNVQLGYFQQSSHKIAFVVDEYGEILGLLTVNDILEEIVGDFTSGVSSAKRLRQDADGGYIVDGSVTVREFNRATGWELPSRGARTINGLVIEYLEALPHARTAILIGEYPLEILQVKERRVKTAKIFPRLTNQ